MSDEAEEAKYRNVHTFVPLWANVANYFLLTSIILFVFCLYFFELVTSWWILGGVALVLWWFLRPAMINFLIKIKIHDMSPRPTVTDFTRDWGKYVWTFEHKKVSWMPLIGGRGTPLAACYHIAWVSGYESDKQFTAVLESGGESTFPLYYVELKKQPNGKYVAGDKYFKLTVEGESLVPKKIAESKAEFAKHIEE